jgi:ATP-dependent Clp protease ATP-binding subunit ClpA
MSRKSSLTTYGHYMTGNTCGPVVGRDDEIDRVISILCCKTKNCAALVGAPGVGKTAIAEGLAQRIAAGKVPAELAEARILELDLGGMVSGTILRGMFEGRLKKVIKEAENSRGKIILFIDEMHMLIGAGSVGGPWGTNDAANMLKPALARGRIRCVGATTFDDYRKYIENDGALERRFQKVHIAEPSMQATIAILRGIKQQYEQHHGVEIKDATVVAAAQLAGRYITGEELIYSYCFLR